MKTPQQWLDSWPPSDLFNFNHEKEQQKTLEFISAIQKEAFECGWDLAVKHCDIASSLNIKPTTLDCCATDQCKVTTETQSPTNPS